MFKGKHFYIKNDLFSNRLKIAMDRINYKQIDLVQKAKIDKALISHYLSGDFMPKQENLKKIAEALEVNEVWLVGYDVDEMEVLREDFILIKTLNEDEQREMAYTLLDYIFDGNDPKFDTKELNDIWIKIRGHYVRG